MFENKKFNLMCLWSIFTTFLLWLFFGMHHLLYGNETDYFLQAKGFLDTQFLISDWYFRGTKFGLVMYSLCTFMFLKIFSPIFIFSVGRLICIGGFVFYFFGLTKKLGIRFVLAFVSLLLFIGLGQSLGAGEHIFGTFEPKNICYLIILASLNYLFLKKHALFLFLLGFSFSFHPILGAWASLIILSSSFIYGLVDFSGRNVGFFVFGGFWGICFWVASIYSFIYSKINGIGFNLQKAQLSVFDVYVFFRNPHHLDIRTILSGMSFGSLILFIGLLGFLMLMVFTRGGFVFEFLKKIRIGDSFIGLDDERGRFKSFLISIVIISLIPVSIASLFGFFRIGTQFLMTYPFRFFDSFGFLISIFLFIHYVFDIWFERDYFKSSSLGKLCSRNRYVLRNSGIIVLLGIVCFFGFLGIKKTSKAISALSYYPKGFGSTISYSKSSFYDVCDWASKNTPVSASFLVSPRLFSFIHLAERSSFLIFKFSPTSPTLIREWMDRVLFLNDGVLPQGRGFSILNELSHKFYSMGPKKINSLSEKYGIDYLLTAKQIKLPYKIAYESGDWIIYSVSKTSILNKGF
ncbi:hypothetical protein HOG98_03000 [bacterium]|jgi:hypothetical protein|nr:hypothetical protein [bacterium]